MKECYYHKIEGPIRECIDKNKMSHEKVFLYKSCEGMFVYNKWSNEGVLTYVLLRNILSKSSIKVCLIGGAGIQKHTS